MKIVEDFQEPYIVSDLRVLDATYIGDYAIRIIFNDGVEKLVDLKPFITKALHPEIKKYLNEDLLKNFEIRNGNLNWNDFDLIFPISDLYDGTI